jgi:predicted nuclease of predicted toxin-antitoxin system
MRFLVDNALSAKAAEGLRTSGHDALHVRDLGMAAASDSELFELAADQNVTSTRAWNDRAECRTL